MVATQKILLTGASGYLGEHILVGLLNQGYNVRITARSPAKAAILTTRYQQFKTQLDFVVVSSLVDPHAYDHALDGITAILHVASPLAHSTDNVERDILVPAIEGTLTILKAASSAKSVSRVIITSSVAAILGGDSKGPLTEKDWNPITYEIAAKSPYFPAYVGSKKLAEQAVWDYVEKSKPHYSVTTICPPFLFGPLPHSIESADELNGTLGLLYTYLETKTGLDTAPDVFMDVRDTALAHILALEKPVAANQRYLVGTGNYSWQEIADIAHKYFPGQTKAEIGTPGVYPPPSIPLDTSKASTQLGLVYRSREDTFRESFAQLVEFRAKRSASK